MITDINRTLIIEPTEVRICIAEWDDNGYVVTMNGRPMGATMPKDKAEIFADYLSRSLPDVLKVLSGQAQAVFPASTHALVGARGSEPCSYCGSFGEHAGTCMGLRQPYGGI